MLTDISSVFLNAWLTEDALYAVEPAPESGLGKESVWKLRRTLYGLRGALRYWQEHLVSFVVEEVQQQGCKMLKSGWVLTKNGDKKRQHLLQRTLPTSVRLQIAGSSQQPRAW